MQNQPSFTIYNASAGSGKTYTLVKDYLKILISSKNLLEFRTILALTFTNKAVGEMKERVIRTLKEFAEESIMTSDHSMFNNICDELDVPPDELHRKSKVLLHTIVHNYAAFDISTIDKFNHRLLRTFAHDLNLPVNFEVELDTKSILSKAVDQLINKAGEDKGLTKVLVDFAVKKTKDDKSWDISYDLNNISELLIRENDRIYIDKFKDKSLKDFKVLHQNLNKQLKAIETQIIGLAQETLELISSNGLDHDAFNRKMLPNHFIKASHLDFEGLYKNNLEEYLANRESIYKKSTDENSKAIIEELIPQFETNFINLKKLVFSSKFIKNVLSNLTPISVLQAINQSLADIKSEEDLLLISEFNNLIHKEISDQPTPFIYERIGERFKHYFIDEFQDTSKLQWENLVPLVGSAISGESISGETGSAMLVGDAKQAIYRWRGGHAEQFIDLYSKSETPFVFEQNVRNLESNFRSHKAIIDFNNSFFDHISEFVFTNEAHKTIYKNAQQRSTVNDIGKVDISFLNIENQDKYELHCNAVYQKIIKALEQGFSLKDVCVIVRKKKEGIAIAEFLKSKEVAVISSETLLLKNAPDINFIIDILSLTVQPNNASLKIKILNYLAQFKLELKDEHKFYKELIDLSDLKMFKTLNTYGFNFHFKSLGLLPIYEGIESIIRGFKLYETSNAYLQFFLDEFYEFSQRNEASIEAFLEFWDRKKDALSIKASDGENAITIMTIHKSKGLEFPVVIFPFANQKIHFDISPKIWFPVDKDSFNGFSHLYITINKDLEQLNDNSREIYETYRSHLELDSINLLYVVLTRAVKQLSIISEYDLDKSGNEKLDFYSGLFINYLKFKNLWKENTLDYTFGSEDLIHESPTVTKSNIRLDVFTSTSKESHNLNIVTNSIKLWDTSQGEAVERGNLIHEIMANVVTVHDIEPALQNSLDSGMIDKEQLAKITPVIWDICNHPKLNSYFRSDLTILNEKDILLPNGKTLRPDRLVINDNEVVIIDYKTGKSKSSDEEQLFDYQEVLEGMGYHITKKILIYINDQITIKEF